MPYTSEAAIEKRNRDRDRNRDADDAAQLDAQLTALRSAIYGGARNDRDHRGGSADDDVLLRVREALRQLADRRQRL